jgi:hypothetical protein
LNISSNINNENQDYKMGTVSMGEAGTGEKEESEGRRLR